MSQPAFLSPEAPTILSFQGPDAVRYLNGQLTQDVSKLDDRAEPACVTDAKGKLQFMVKVMKGPEDGQLWLTCPAAQSEGLRERIERYLIADDVEVEDLSGQWRVHHGSEAIPSIAGFVRKADGPWGSGHDLWWPADESPELVTVSADQAESLRIASGLPAWGKELKEGLLPPEAGLDRSAISYHKGCYIGQEVLSRIKSAGRLNRRLALLKLSAPAAPGSEICLDGKPIGEITSISPLPSSEGDYHALGYLKKAGFEHQDFLLNQEQGPIDARFVRWA